MLSLLFFCRIGANGHVLRMKDKEILSGSVSLSLHGCAVQPSLSAHRHGLHSETRPLSGREFSPPRF